jgi:hypothetical protein
MELRQNATQVASFVFAGEVDWSVAKCRLEHAQPGWMVINEPTWQGGYKIFPARIGLAVNLDDPQSRRENSRCVFRHGSAPLDCRLVPAPWRSTHVPMTVQKLCHNDVNLRQRLCCASTLFHLGVAHQHRTAAPSRQAAARNRPGCQPDNASLGQVFVAHFVTLARREHGMVLLIRGLP